VINFDLSGADRIRATYQARLDRLAHLSTPLNESAAVTRDSVVKRFTNNSWPPNSASTIAQKGSSRPGIDTGRLRSSISATDATDSTVSVGTNVAYARWFQKGRGAFDLPKKDSGAYRFMAGGKPIFRRGPIHVGAQPARPFLYFDDPTTERIRRIFARYIISGTEAAE